MLLAQSQQRLELLVFALILLGGAHVLLHREDFLLQLRVFRLQRLIAEDIVIVPLCLPVDGSNAGADRRENRPDDVFSEARPARDAENDGDNDGKHDSHDQDRLQPRRPEILFQSITSPRRMPALL